jgi:hypothetical protein
MESQSTHLTGRPLKKESDAINATVMAAEKAEWQCTTASTRCA